MPIPDHRLQAYVDMSHDPKLTVVAVASDDLREILEELARTAPAWKALDAIAAAARRQYVPKSIHDILKNLRGKLLTIQLKTSSG